MRPKQPSKLRPSTPIDRWGLSLLRPALLISWLLICVACTTPATRQNNAPSPPAQPLPLVIRVDGETLEISTTASTVADALTEAGIILNPADEVDPLPSTTISIPAGAASMPITVIRVTETSEVIPESIPYERRIVRSAELSADDEPRLLQSGEPGLQEVSVRIVYRDGLEVERWPTAVSIIEPPVDEIILIGIGSNRDAMAISGRLAYINDGRAIILEGSTDSPRQLDIEGRLDGRVFQLSPDGNHLLYTVNTTDNPDQISFRNELWVTNTAEGNQPVPLQIENVLWAGWDPAATSPSRIAYTTARSVALPPGWEANNDLWVMDIQLDGQQPAPTRLIETYPAAFAWWGGNYSWSPTGDRLAYAFADEIGLLSIPPSTTSDGATGFAVAPEPVRTILHSFSPYDTGADWAWVPALGWSADGRYLAFVDHNDETSNFDLWLADTGSSNKVVIVDGAGIWSAAQWSPAAEQSGSRIATLQTADAAAGEESSYALWLVDEDGSNSQRVFPPEGESGRFARSSQSLVWGPAGNTLAFIFDEALHILDLSSGDSFRAGQDDTISSHPSWAPYGAANR